jgi:hypothetical protein
MTEKHTVAGPKITPEIANELSAHVAVATASAMHAVEQRTGHYPEVIMAAMMAQAACMLAVYSSPAYAVQCLRFAAAGIEQNPEIVADLSLLAKPTEGSA